MPKPSTRSATRRSAPQPPEGALLRFILDSGRWAESLPPVPNGAVVTVSFTSTAAAVEHGDALSLLGYRLVPGPGAALGPAGDHADDGGTAVSVADILVTRALAESHPTWWRALATLADRLYNLSHGPVHALLGDVLAEHLAARE